MLSLSCTPGVTPSDIPQSTPARGPRILWFWEMNLAVASPHGTRHPQPSRAQGEHSHKAPEAGAKRLTRSSRDSFVLGSSGKERARVEGGKELECFPRHLSTGIGAATLPHCPEGEGTFVAQGCKWPQKSPQSPSKRGGEV